MAELLIGALLLMLLLRVLSEGESVELEDLLGVPQLIALTAVAVIVGIIGLLSQRQPLIPGTHYPALGMMGLAAAGLLLVLFPERMPDTTRGGTMMTTFWSVFGWALIVLAYAVVFFI